MGETSIPRGAVPRCARLADQDVTDGELCDFESALGLPKGPDLRQAVDYVARRCDALPEKLTHLFGTLGHSGKKRMATEFAVGPTRVSRWLNGAFEPHPECLQRLAWLLGLPGGDHRIEPVFLWVDLFTADDRRAWLHAKIDELSTDEVRDFHPPLHRNLERS